MEQLLLFVLLNARNTTNFIFSVSIIQRLYLAEASFYYFIGFFVLIRSSAKKCYSKNIKKDIITQNHIR